MANALVKGGGTGLSLHEQDYLHESVLLAGLCHDLGHGPWSHFFDRTVMPSLYPNLSWTHEMASEMMLEYLIDDNSIDISSDQTKLI
jgi:HD superfamily phosphohydrolase